MALEHVAGPLGGDLEFGKEHGNNKYEGASAVSAYSVILNCNGAAHFELNFYGVYVSFLIDFNSFSSSLETLLEKIFSSLLVPRFTGKRNDCR